MKKKFAYKNMREWAEALTAAVDAEMRNPSLAKKSPTHTTVRPTAMDEYPIGPSGLSWGTQEQVRARLFGRHEALAVVQDVPSQLDADVPRN